MRIGFIGVGNMGGPIAAHLVAAGHDLSVFDIDAHAVMGLVEGGATQGSSVSDVAENAEVVFLSLPMPSDVANVVAGDGGVFSAMQPGGIVVTSAQVLRR